MTASAMHSGEYPNYPRVSTRLQIKLSGLSFVEVRVQLLLPIHIITTISMWPSLIGCTVDKDSSEGLHNEDSEVGRIDGGFSTRGIDNLRYFSRLSQFLSRASSWWNQSRSDEDPDQDWDFVERGATAREKSSTWTTSVDCRSMQTHYYVL